MPSHLRLQVDVQSTQSYFPHPTAVSPPAKKQRMSLTQTYRIASTARSKLGREAARGDHDLRLLVGHANLLDTLMVELADAEREQESWFNENLRAQAKPEGPKHVQWFDSILEEHEDDLSDSEDDSDADSDIDTEDFPVIAQSAPRRRSVSPPPPVPSSYVLDDDDDDDEDDYEFDDEHALSRVPSHTPDLIHEDSEESDDDSMPSSPPTSAMEFEPQSSDLSDLFQKVPEKLSRPAVVHDDMFQSHTPQMISAY
ncbi:hypothetical protein MBLNU457_5987t2 [Dothideomycetes sp. NU457]